MYRFITIAIETGWINCHPSDIKNETILYSVITLNSNLRNFLFTKDTKNVSELQGMSLKFFKGDTYSLVKIWMVMRVLVTIRCMVRSRLHYVFFRVASPFALTFTKASPCV